MKTKKHTPITYLAFVNWCDKHDFIFSYTDEDKQTFAFYKDRFREEFLGFFVSPIFSEGGTTEVWYYKDNMNGHITLRTIEDLKKY